MHRDSSHSTPVDTRIIAYRIVKQITLIIVIGILIKSCALDAVRIRGDQMSPSLLNGDRIIIFKTPYLPLVSKITTPPQNRTVVFRHPVDPDKHGCLRMAAVSGEAIAIDSGIATVKHEGRDIRLRRAVMTEVLPRQYSQRDFMTAYTIPFPGQTIDIPSLPLRDFFFTASIIRQENRESSFSLTPSVKMGDTVYHDFPLTDFSLYKGNIRSIPAQYRYDWFFWDRVLEYLRYSQSDSTIVLNFTLSKDGQKLNRYTVRDRYIFLLADNWGGGLDSRYFGPIKKEFVLGSSCCVLWSYGKNTGGRSVLRAGRFGRIVR